MRDIEICPCGATESSCLWSRCQSRVQRHHILQAVAWSDLLGRREFLEQYALGEQDFGLLIFDKCDYECKAILRTAFHLATGEKLGPGDFGHDSRAAADFIRGLGFEVHDARDWLPSIAHFEQSAIVQLLDEINE